VRRVFISFSGDDVKIAEYLTNVLNHVFAGQARFFCSSVGLESGALWLNTIRNEIQAADAILVLLSPRTFQRPWINIEAGAFWASGKSIHPLLHGGLSAGDLHRPLSDYQGVDINSVRGIQGLMAILAEHMNMSYPPPYDAASICQQVNLMDRGARSTLPSWPALAQALGVSSVVPECERLDSYEITKELDGSSVRVLRDQSVELNGYSTDSMLFTFRGPQPLPSANYLVINCQNTAETKSLEYGLFMKVLFKQDVLLPHLEYQRHSRDEQFTGLNDGYFPYDIGWVPTGDQILIRIVLWRAQVSRLRLRLYII
jgi:TIR domain